VNCAVKSSAVVKVTQSRNFNCTNVRNFQHTLDLTAQLLTVQLKLKVKLHVWGALATVFDRGVAVCIYQPAVTQQSGDSVLTLIFGYARLM
jgi:hypothetical protein